MRANAMGNQEFSRIILEKMHEALKPCGFRKRGSTFTKKADDDVVLMVNLQKSVSSSRAFVKATVNLGVFSFSLARKMSRAGLWVRTLVSPTVWDGHWQERIGSLLPERNDKWWEIRDMDEAVAAGAEIAKVLTTYGLPALEAVASTDRLRALWESGQSPGVTEKQRLDYLRALGSDADTAESPSQA